MRDVLAERASENFVGRTGELSALLACLEEDGPLVVYLHGMAGLGKSALLGEFACAARTRGAVLVHLDGRLIEPTPQGFEAELSKHAPLAGERAVLIIDGYELLRLLDTWLRQVFIPGLQSSVRIVLCSRQPPVPSWRTAPEWQGLFRAVPLGPLAERDALALLARNGLDAGEARRVNRFAKGHPLTLRLAATAPAPLEHLGALYLAEIADPVTRRAMEAVSVLRRVTRSLAAAIVPECPQAYERLSAVSFVEVSCDGLIIHDAVREPVAASLRSADPVRYAETKRAAWKQLRKEVSSVRWRKTADLLFLLENLYVREAFFPSSSQQLAVEPARERDREAIFGIVQRHEPPAAAASLAHWWEHVPEAFHVTRNARGDVAGFYLMFEWRRFDPALLATDLPARGWWQHLQQEPVAPNETAVYLRRWLSLEYGESPSPVQAECWLDVKRSYLELRPRLRRCYISVCDLAAYRPAAQQLGFRHIERASAAIDGLVHHLAVLDFGPNSVDGWLGDLLARELGEEPASILDVDARELVLSGRRVTLTPLEFGVLRHLSLHEGTAIPRTELLERVWGQPYDGGSNVVDVVVRSLRKKLGDRAGLLGTVRGFGYRWRGTTESS